jgi:hypothetical protein
MDDDDEPDLSKFSLDLVMQKFDRNPVIDQLFLDVIKDIDLAEEEDTFEPIQQNNVYLGLVMDEDLSSMNLTLTGLRAKRVDEYVRDSVQEDIEVYDEYQQKTQEFGDYTNGGSNLERIDREDIRNNISDDIRVFIASVKQVVADGVGYAKHVYFIKVNPDDM